jgi:hypothetical protein
MLHGLRLSVVALCLAGCASQFLAVPDSDWQTVPAPARASVDKQNDAELASARTELAAASASVAALQRSQPAPLPPAPARTARKPDPDSDAWEVAVYDHEQARITTFTRVENARVDWLRTDRAWRERWLAAAEARIEMVICKRELVRAQTIDRNLPGSDHYDTAPLRGQFSRAQQRWHILQTSSREARAAHERASATLASSKEAYAQLMRTGPGQSAERTADERAARLELSSWAIKRGDIKRRRGLRNYLETVAKTPPTLRKRAFKLRSPAIVIQMGTPAPEAPPAETPRAPATPPGSAAAPANPAVAAPGLESARPATASASATGKPVVPARGKTPPSDGMKPWDNVEPAGATASPAAAAARKTAGSATAVSPKPWDIVEPAARAPVAGKPAATARATPASAAPATATPTSAAPARTGPTPAAATAERVPPPAPQAPGSATPARVPRSAPATTNAAKPVESPAGARTP